MFRQSVFASVAFVATLLPTTFLTAPAQAGAPANQSCLGADSSTAARALHDTGSNLGAVVSEIATGSPRAIGDEVRAHLAGQIPDDVFPNSCNDQ